MPVLSPNRFEPRARLARASRLGAVSGRAVRALLLAAVLGCLASSALAQQAQPAAEDRAQSFEAVTGSQKEDVPGGPLLVAAYAIVWLCVFGYVFRLGRLHGRVEQNLSRIEAAVASAQNRAPGSE